MIPQSASSQKDQTTQQNKSSVSRQQQLIKSYFICKILLAIINIILGSIYFSNTQDLKQIDAYQYILHNWQLEMINDLKILPSNQFCPENYQPFLVYDYPGRPASCDCTAITSNNTKYYNLENKIYERTCDIIQKKVGCINFIQQDPAKLFNMQINDSDVFQICVFRIPSMNFFTQGNSYQQCQQQLAGGNNNFKVCGGSREETLFCVNQNINQNIACPINYISFSSDKNNFNSTLLSMNNMKIQISDHSDNYPLTSILITEENLHSSDQQSTITSSSKGEQIKFLGQISKYQYFSINNGLNLVSTSSTSTPSPQEENSLKSQTMYIYSVHYVKWNINCRQQFLQDFLDNDQFNIKILQNSQFLIIVLIFFELFVGILQSIYCFFQTYKPDVSQCSHIIQFMLKFTFFIIFVLSVTINLYQLLRIYLFLCSILDKSCTDQYNEESLLKIFKVISTSMLPYLLAIAGICTYQFLVNSIFGILLIKSIKKQIFKENFEREQRIKQIVELQQQIYQKSQNHEISVNYYSAGGNSEDKSEMPLHTTETGINGVQYSTNSNQQVQHENESSRINSKKSTNTSNNSSSNNQILSNNQIQQSNNMEMSSNNQILSNNQIQQSNNLEYQSKIKLKTDLISFQSLADQYSSSKKQQLSSSKKCNDNKGSKINSRSNYNSCPQQIENTQWFEHQYHRKNIELIYNNQQQNIFNYSNIECMEQSPQRNEEALQIHYQNQSPQIQRVQQLGIGSPQQLEQSSEYQNKQQVGSNNDSQQKTLNQHISNLLSNNNIIEKNKQERKQQQQPNYL